MTTAPETAGDSQVVTCWCCGGGYPEDLLVRLGDHPEVAVCAGCAAYLNRRAREKGPATAATRRIRGVAGAVRRSVMQRGWQDKPVVGRALRWLDRHSPW